MGHPGSHTLANLTSQALRSYPVSRFVSRVQPPLAFIAPNLDTNMVRLTYALLPLWMRWKTALTEVEATNLEELVSLYQQFQSGKIRMLLAFRHPSVDDPVCIGYMLSRLLPRTAQSMGVRFPDLIHAHFMYDRGIPLWAGSAMGWLYAKLGGTPIMRGKVDRAGLRSARDLLANGRFPLIAAPEGGTNGHSELISPLEPGLSQFGFWCVEDLQKAGRSEEVLIVPIGVQYKYITPPWTAIEQLLAQLEADCGFKSDSQFGYDTLDEALYRRMYRLGEHLLSMMEEYYQRFYHQDIPPYATVTGNPNERFGKRLSTLLDIALKVAERDFNLQPRGTVIDRCRRLEQAAWDAIHREDLNLESLSAVERGLADRIAEEASFRIWHMRLVETFVAVTGQYVREKMTVDRFAETLILMWEMIAKIKGEQPSFDTPKLGKQRAYLTIGQPISVSDRWVDYTRDRKSAKQAVANLTQDLHAALQSMIR
ncbi:1-acyl-sn-glycerol-3-phosphate acyltransferase [Alkalinema pantanalense]|uniref:1-acyl-sn-glycerol-3-phosphate acyltransferase n=1 Tax=Alkalinema pantanalense TaxID=1620705 RepID=UPI003D701CBD